MDVLIPSALYFLSLYPLDTLQRAEHPKLAYEHPSKPASDMSPQLINDYIIMYQGRIETIIHFIRKFVGERTPTANCTTATCQRGFHRLAKHLGLNWQTRTGPLHYMRQGIRHMQDVGSVCLVCQKEFEKDVNQLREEVWEKLPQLAGFDLTWEELREQACG